MRHFTRGTYVEWGGVTETADFWGMLCQARGPLATKACAAGKRSRRRIPRPAVISCSGRGPAWHTPTLGADESKGANGLFVAAADRVWPVTKGRRKGALFWFSWADRRRPYRATIPQRPRALF